MPNERDVQTPAGVVFTATAEDRKENTVTVPTRDEQNKETEVEKKARFARILERGYMTDMFAVPNLPDDLHGEWVANTSMEINRLSALGFVDGSQYVANRTAHHSGNKPQIADVVFMTQPMDEHKLWVKMRQERFDEINGRGKKQNIEEKQFVDSVEGLKNDKSGGQATPVIVASDSVTRVLQK